MVACQGQAQAQGSLFKGFSLGLIPPLPLSPMDTKQGALSSRIVASKQKFQAHKQAEGGKEYRTTSLCDFLRLLRNIIMHHTPGV